MPKYTLIIPTRNSIEYLKDCIDSVISQDFFDYELIVSNNHSMDDTFKYVKSLNHPNIKLIKPEKPLAMVDNWEWALSHASGEWIIIVGADDGVMPYFFELAEFLTQKAVEKKIRAINSIRSYFFWNGCQEIYGNIAVSFNAQAHYSIKNSKIEILNALIGNQNYINMPQMYTTSIIHKSVIQRIKAKQNQNFYVSINPDANGAAAICSIEDKYLECNIPLSWVGSSPKSNGLIYQHQKEKYKQEFSINMNSERIIWNKLAGAFNNGNDRIVNNFKLYFYESLLQTHSVQSFFWKSVYNSKFIKTLLYAALHYEIQQTPKIKDEQTEFLKEMTELNNISFNSVLNFEKYLLPKVKKIFLRIQNINNKFSGFNKAKSLAYNKNWENDMNMRLMDAYKIIDNLVKEKDFVTTFIS